MMMLPSSSNNYDPVNQNEDETGANTNFVGSMALNYGKQGVSKVKQLAILAKDGSLPLKVMISIGGGYMILSGVLGVLSSIISLKPFTCLMDIYIAFFGVVIVVLESKDKFCSKERKQKLFEMAKFLSFVWGRGAFIMFCGTLLTFSDSWLDLVAGFSIVILGGYMLYTGRQTAKHLELMKTELPAVTEHDLDSIFQKYDTDQSGQLEAREFEALAKELGIEMSPSELETAMEMMDSQRSGKVSRQAFKDWFQKENSEFSVIFGMP
mmetsp:Transcript_30052/g.39545  ORF Transcript_30052/g.39545 Transcript_30052/m.39545 type:complete len:266 (-) Transcript_30052:185-982(-)